MYFSQELDIYIKLDSFVRIVLWCVSLVEELIDKKIREIKTKLLRLQMLQNLEANAAFLDISTKTEENIKKLQLGPMSRAIEEFMPLLINKNLDSIKVKNSLRLNKITDEIIEDINEIFRTISKSINISEEERRALIESPVEEKKDIIEATKD